MCIKYEGNIIEDEDEENMRLSPMDDLQMLDTEGKIYER
jgi:hypothetical protein